MSKFKVGDEVVFNYARLSPDGLQTLVDLYKPQIVSASFEDEDLGDVISLALDYKDATWSAERFELLSEWEARQQKIPAEQELELTKLQVSSLQILVKQLRLQLETSERLLHNAKRHIEDYCKECV